jgi:hypothetical protein
VALALAAMGCSKSGSKSTTDPGAAEAAALAGDESLANGDFVAADAHYHDALAKDGNNGHANLGAAITGLAMMQSDPGVDSLLTFVGTTPVPAPAARATRPSHLLARLALSPRMSYDPLSNGRGLARLLYKSTADPIMASWYQGVVKNRIMPRLQYVEDRMNILEANPSFTYMVPTAISGATVPIEVDLGEVLAIDAMVNSLQGVLGVLLAYNFDAPPTATPAELLAMSTFGALHTDGAAQLTAARANLLLAVTRLGAMETFIGAEGDDQSDDVIPAEALAMPDFVALEDGYTRMQTALTSTVPVDVDAYDGSVKQVDIAAGAFFTAPIMDWKSYVPTHTFDSITGDLVITNPVTFPLPMFNGIFPNMDNPKWQAIIGPVNSPAATTR